MIVEKEANVQPRTSNRLDLLDFAVIAAENLKILLLVTALVGLIVFGIVLVLPRNYASTAFLSMDQKDAGAAQVLITSVVLDEVADKFPDADGSSSSRESHRESLRKRVTWTPTGGDRRNATVYELTVNQTNPERAQNINTALITTWLDISKPRPIERGWLTEQLRSTESQLEAVSKIIDKYTKEATTFITPTNIQGEIASPFVKILDQRAKLTESIVSLKKQIAGKTSDAILSSPTLPTQGSSRIIAFSLSALVTIMAAALTWIFLCLKVMIERLDPNDKRAKKLAQIGAALRFRRKTA